jgi:ribosomal protein L1
MSLQTAIEELKEAEVQVRTAAQSLYGARTAALAHTATDIAQEIDALRRQVEEKAAVVTADDIDTGYITADRIDIGEGDTPDAEEAGATDERG